MLELPIAAYIFFGLSVLTIVALLGALIWVIINN